MRRLPEVRGADGMTLIELMVAVIIFTTVMLAGGRFVGGAVQQLQVSETRSLAMEYAVEKIEEIKLLPFDEIVAEDPLPVPGAPDYLRSVEVRRVGADPKDLYSYQVVTVVVQPPGSFEPVELSTGIAP